MKIVCCLRSEESYKRIKFQVNNENIEWEDFINDIDYLREKIAFIYYDLAIVDEKLWWKDDAVSLFKNFNIDIIFFEGDFEHVFKNVMERLSSDNENTEYIIEDEEGKNEDEKPIKYIEIEVEKIKEVKVKVPVYKEVYTNIPKKLIMVTNLSKRAGSTFITLNLAKAFSKYKVLPAVIEPPLDLPYIFDTIGLEQRLNKTSNEESLLFYSYPHEIYENNQIKKDRETIEDDIVWIVPDARKPIIDSNKWDYYMMMKLIYCSKKASITIVDIGSFINHESVKSILDYADMILVVIDPLPTEIMQNNSTLQMLLDLKYKGGLPIEFVINKWSNGIDKPELFDYLKLDPLTIIPAVDLSYIHKAIYSCLIPYSLEQVEKMLEKPIYKIIKRVIPREFFIDTQVNTKSKDKAIISKLSGFFKKKKG